MCIVSIQAAGYCLVYKDLNAVLDIHPASAVIPPHARLRTPYTMLTKNGASTLRGPRETSDAAHMRRRVSSVFVRGEWDITRTLLVKHAGESSGFDSLFALLDVKRCLLLLRSFPNYNHILLLAFPLLLGLLFRRGHIRVSLDLNVPTNLIEHEVCSVIPWNQIRKSA